MRSVFCAISSRKSAALIGDAKRRVLLAVPSVRADVAAAMLAAHTRLGEQNVRLVLDCDEETFRLGYGDVAAVKQLSDAEVDVRQCSGLRTGLLLVDDRAWVFTPTALYVQADVHSDETPNAIELVGTDVDRLAAAICPPAAEITGSSGDPQIGQLTLDAQTVKQVEAALELAPPIPFDVARQVRVFQPYIQYVEISLRGCSIQRHRVTIPKSILGVGAGKEIEARLRTTFELIEKSSNLTSEALDKELKDLRVNWTRPLGEPWGRVLLRSVRKEFDNRIAAFRTKLAEFRTKIDAELKKKLAESRRQVVEYYLPRVKANPPDSLRGQLASVKPTNEEVRSWLDAELDREFPSSEKLLTGMVLDIQFRDVTYETLNEPNFAEALEEAYPHVNWGKPFAEFNAAKEGDPGRKP